MQPGNEEKESQNNCLFELEETICLGMFLPQLVFKYYVSVSSEINCQLRQLKRFYKFLAVTSLFQLAGCLVKPSNGCKI